MEKKAFADTRNILNKNGNTILSEKKNVLKYKL